MKKSIFTYSLVWIAVIAWFWIMYHNINPMDYSIFVFYLILPLAAIIGSAKAVIRDCSFKAAVFGSMFMGFAYCAADYCTFSLANMIANDFSRGINHLMLILVLPGVIFTLIGFGIGGIIKLINHR